MCVINYTSPKILLLIQPLIGYHHLDETEDSEVRLKQLETMIQEANQKTWSLTPPLDLVHDLFIDQDIYQVHNDTHIYIYYQCSAHTGRE